MVGTASYPRLIGSPVRESKEEDEIILTVPDLTSFDMPQETVVRKQFRMSCGGPQKLTNIQDVTTVLEQIDVGVRIRIQEKWGVLDKWRWHL